MAKKIKVKLIGKNGNIFNLMGIASRALKDAGQADDAQKMQDRIVKCGSYGDALCIIGDYVDIV